MDMNKIFLPLITLIFFCNTNFAQQNGNDRVEALKIAFLTERLQLTKSEAQSFWPVYNSYESEVRSLRTKSRNGSVIENEEKLLQIKKKYNGSFEKILGKDKTNTLFNSEKEFRNILIKRLKNRGAGGRNH